MTGREEGKMDWPSIWGQYSSHEKAKECWEQRKELIESIVGEAVSRLVEEEVKKALDEFEPFYVEEIKKDAAVKALGMAVSMLISRDYHDGINMVRALADRVRKGEEKI